MNRAGQVGPDADDADMYEELGNQDVASALADYLADNSLENAVRDIIYPFLLPCGCKRWHILLQHSIQSQHAPA